MYTLHLWNGQYGNGAKFIVENSDGKFAEFTPARPKDVAWVDVDLTQEQEYRNWEDFQKEQVEDINDIIM